MPAAARLSPGRVFAGDYRIVDLLAEGGMGTLYRAEQLSTRKIRALKLVHARLASDPKARERFVREATVGASIDSEHVVEVIAAGVDEEGAQPWLVMELLEGADLGSLVEHRGPLSLPAAVVVMRQLGHGLAAAHRAGVIHRDLKPANIFIARSRRAGAPFTVKVLDFGIAKVVEGERSGATETETVGSPMWMAPEQLDAQRPCPGTDVWALGLIGFWILTGKHYWRAAHVPDRRVQALFVEQLFKPIEPASERAAEYGVVEAIPPGFDDWFAACLQRDPSARLRDAAAAITALREAVGIDPSATEVGDLLPDEPLPPSQTHVERAVHGTTLMSADATQTTQDVPRPTSAAMEPTIGPDEPIGADLSRADLDPPAPAIEAPPPRGRVATALGLVAVALAIVGGGAWWAVTGGPFATSVVAGEEGREPLDPAEPVEPIPEPPPIEPTPPPTPVPPPPPIEAGPVVELVVPARHQPSYLAHELRFEGWSADSRRFVLHATHREDDDELELVQIHDALTGAMVESFSTARPSRIRTRGRGELRRLAAQASAAAGLQARRDALALVEPEATRTPPRGSLEIAADDDVAGTTLRLREVAKGATFDWSGFVSPPPAGAERARAPFVNTTFVDDDGTRWPLLSVHPPLRYDEIAARSDAEHPNVRVLGRLDFHWSPDGRRVVVIVRGAPDPRSPDDPLRSDRWFLRAVGPQIHVLEAGAGQQVAREVARALEAAGLPTAALSLREPIVAHSEIYHRAQVPGAEALAGRIRDAIRPALDLEPVKGDGWTAAIVVLGQDLAP